MTSTASSVDILQEAIMDQIRQIGRIVPGSTWQMRSNLIRRAV